MLKQAKVRRYVELFLILKINSNKPKCIRVCQMPIFKSFFVSAKCSTSTSSSTSTTRKDFDCGKHATFIYGGNSCELTCAGINEPCCVVHVRAPDACYCNKGYRRDKYGHCILEKSQKCQKEKLPKCKCNWACVNGKCPNGKKCINGGCCNANPDAEFYQPKMH